MHNLISWTHCFLFCVHNISRCQDNFGNTGAPIVLKSKRLAWYFWNWWLNKKWNACEILQILFQESINSVEFYLLISISQYFGSLVVLWSRKVDSVFDLRKDFHTKIHMIGPLSMLGGIQNLDLINFSRILSIYGTPVSLWFTANELKIVFESTLHLVHYRSSYKNNEKLKTKDI